MLKVLIVDDEAVVRRGIVLGIDWASLGCAVVGEAANGEEGLAAAERYSPNLIITDVRMPHMDGIEMMRVLRERGSKHLRLRLRHIRRCSLRALIEHRAHEPVIIAAALQRDATLAVSQQNERIARREAEHIAHLLRDHDLPLRADAHRGHEFVLHGLHMRHLRYNLYYFSYVIAQCHPQRKRFFNYFVRAEYYVNQKAQKRSPCRPAGGSHLIE